MWNVNGNTLRMTEGDFGINLPIEISGTTLSSADTIKIEFKQNGTSILAKDLVPTENVVNLVLTEAETALFAHGVYTYSLDWYQEGTFMCNIIPVGNFKVVDK